MSTPLSWDELTGALADDDADALRFEADAVLARVERFGDLYAESLAGNQELPDLR